MTNDNYAKAYKEVLEILKYVPEHEVIKIPKEVLEVFQQNQDKSYDFKIDINKEFEEQTLLKETEAILANLYRDYWATSEQKQEIISKENKEKVQIEYQKRERYNPDDIFKDRKAINNTSEILRNQNLPDMIQKENFFERIKRYLKKIFKFWGDNNK